MLARLASSASDPLGLYVIPLVLALLWLVLLWLTLFVAGVVQWPRHLIQIAASLLTAWVVIRLVSQLAPSPNWAKLITWVVWSVAALSILNLLDPTIGMLDAVALETPRFRISVFSVLKSAAILAVLVTIAVYVTRLVEVRIRGSVDGAQIEPGAADTTAAPGTPRRPRGTAEPAAPLPP